MKTLKTILLSLFIAASMGAVSTSALAESDPGRVTYKPAEAIDMVTAKIQAAIEGISKGASGDEEAHSPTRRPRSRLRTKFSPRIGAARRNALKSRPLRDRRRKSSAPTTRATGRPCLVTVCGPRRMLSSMTSLRRAFASCNCHSFATSRSNLVRLVRPKSTSVATRESRSE